MSEKDIEFDENGEEIVASAATETEVVDDNDSQSDVDSHVEHDEEGDDEPSAKKSEDSELADAEDDNEREAIRERRRQERARKKQANRDREDTLRRELAARDSVINELRSKVDLIEKRNSGTELAQLETSKKQVAQAYAHFKDQIRLATEAGNGAAVADATEKLLQSQRKFDELTTYEKAMKDRQTTQQQPAQQLDPRLVANAQEWMGRHKWYDPNNEDDIDSSIVRRIDQQLSKEGWNPTTKDYWSELDMRMKNYLPHRVQGNKPTTKPKSVVSGSGREGSNAGNKSSYTLSADRVKALKDAGIYDDPKLRADAIKRFREYDRENT